MYDKYNSVNPLSLFNLLPEEIVEQISKKLLHNKEAHQAYTLTCQNFFKIANGDRLGPTLSYFISTGNQLKTEEMLKRYPELLLRRADIRDKSGRCFEKTTVWEYILWALDVKYMGPLILNCLPYNELGHYIAKELLSQLEQLEKQGVTYILDGKHYCEKHYDFAILTTLKTFADQFTTWNWEQKIEYWAKEVRKAQFYVPAHIAQHYCAPEPFNDEILSRTLTFYNRLTKKNESWWSEKSIEEIVLTSDFALVKDRSGCSVVNYTRGTNICAQRDFKELTTLYCTRLTKDLPALKQKLLEFIHHFDLQNPIVNPG